jgi:hypothetical protein
MLNKDAVREVRAMLERHWPADAIATRLKLDLSAVQDVIKLLHTHKTFG